MSFCLLLCGIPADGVGSPGENHLSVPVSDHGAWATAMNNLGIMPMGISGQQLVSGTFFSELCRTDFTSSGVLGNQVICNSMSRCFGKAKTHFVSLYSWKFLYTLGSPQWDTFWNVLTVFFLKHKRIGRWACKLHVDTNQTLDVL